MSEQTEADRAIINNADAAELVEQVKRDAEKSLVTVQQEKEEAIAYIAEMAGNIKGTNFYKTQAEFFNLLKLKQVKDAKDYRNKLGMTWDKFCKSVGVKRRTIDLHLEDLEPFRQEFLVAFASFSGAPINKIKYLGMAVNQNLATVAENAIICNGETIPLDAEHKDDIQALLETLEENHKKEKEELEAALSSNKKVLADKEKVMNRQERDLKRLEKTVEKSDLTPEEQDAVNLLSQVQMDFLTWHSDIKKKIKPHEAPEIALRQLYFLYIFISKVCMEERLALHEAYQNAEDVPWEIMEQEIPDADVLIDNLPLSAGKGMGKR